MNYNTRYKKRKHQEIYKYDIIDDSSDSDYETESESESEELEYESDDVVSYKDFVDEMYQKETKDTEDTEDTEEEYEEFIQKLTNGILKSAQKQLERENQYDDYDKEFEILCKGDDFEQDFFEEDFNYFKKLNQDEKINYIDKLKNLKKINNNIPTKFKILDLNVPENTKSIILNNINKLNQMDPSNGEYYKMKNWIDGVLKIPFNDRVDLPVNIESNVSDKQQFLKKSHDILNKAIYGHEKAKSYILQVICKWIQKSDSQGNILALQGPMGNGKTTLIKNGVAKAINRPFAFISLGGASDSSYFNGHSYTYEGSTWGRIIDILMKSKCMNPIIYFDELDKVSNTHKGDEIIHFLTHITDLSQNSVYQDNYFPGINIDLSKILFIFSFNDENKIDKILKDRMHVIRTTGFKTDDKIKIFKNYLIPDLYKNYSLSENDIIFDDDIIKKIIDDYTQKESGVRNLKRCIDVIISKINMYEILYDKIHKCIYIDLPYKLKNFEIPYKLKNEDLPVLLDSIVKDLDKPPEHMYL